MNGLLLVRPQVGSPLTMCAIHRHPPPHTHTHAPQLDSVICSKQRHLLKHFIDMDRGWWGAPWRCGAMGRWARGEGREYRICACVRPSPCAPANARREVRELTNRPTITHHPFSAPQPLGARAQDWRQRRLLAPQEGVSVLAAQTVRSLAFPSLSCPSLASLRQCVRFFFPFRGRPRFFLRAGRSVRLTSIENPM